MLYGASVWDPVLIVFQIVSLQCLFYLSLGLWQAVFIGPYVGRLTILYLFSYKTFNVHTYVGWISIVSALLNAVLSAVFLLWIVERAKKCLDFACTTYFLHLCFCWRFAGFPARLEWWATNIAGLVISSLLGEWLCLRREMQEIPINALRGRGGGGAGTSSGTGGVELASAGGGLGAAGKGMPKGAAGGGAPRGDAAV